MAVFNEDTRVKIPATIQFLRLGYEYQSLKDIDLHTGTRIVVNRFKPALERINGRSYSDAEIQAILDEVHLVIRNNDMGRTFYRWLINPQDKPVLVDFEHIENNNYAVVDELTFGKEGSENEKEGSFRPDITVLINGIPLGFLEVKHPNNEGGIQAEFNRIVIIVFLPLMIPICLFVKMVVLLKVISISFQRTVCLFQNSIHSSRGFGLL